MNKRYFHSLDDCLVNKTVFLFSFVDDEDSMEYLDDWDQTIPNLDVVQDYRSEKKQIIACQGKGFPFSFGDVSQANHTLVVDICLLFKVHRENSDGWCRQLVR